VAELPSATQDVAAPRPLFSTLQILQRKESKRGPRGDAEGESRDQPRSALAIHLPSPLIGTMGPEPLRLGELIRSLAAGCRSDRGGDTEKPEVCRFGPRGCSAEHCATGSNDL
jgi:hypothetical protein